MTRSLHDQFAKQYLAELLAPLGEVETSREVAGEVQQVDVWFAPAPEPAADPQLLGLLGKMPSSPCLIEPFRNAPKPTEIRNCLLKLSLHSELQRKARRDRSKLSEADLPRLWILSPTASPELLEGFNTKLDENNWSHGVYFLGVYLKTALVAINKLPPTEETLWLRILGKRGTQERAINELTALPTDRPLRRNALELLSNWRMNLERSENLTEEDRQLIMNLSPAYLQWRTETLHEGRREERRATLENLFRVRFGTLDEELSGVIDPLLQLPSEEFTLLLLHLSNMSREELLARFNA